jgi:hypothetical protein
MTSAAKRNSTAKPTPPAEPPPPDPPEAPEDDELAGERSGRNDRIAFERLPLEKRWSWSFVVAPPWIRKSSKPNGDVSSAPVVTAVV